MFTIGPIDHKPPEEMIPRGREEVDSRVSPLSSIYTVENRPWQELISFIRRVEYVGRGAKVKKLCPRIAALSY
jgi:hypothetical protein